MKSYNDSCTGALGRCFAIVVLWGLWLFVYAQSNEIPGVKDSLKAKYPYVVFNEYDGNYSIYNVKDPFGKDKKERKEGVANLQGEVMIEPDKYSSIYLHSGRYGYYTVSVGKLHGICSLDGVEMVPPIYKNWLSYTTWGGDNKWKFTYYKKGKDIQVETFGYLNPDGTFNYNEPEMEDKELTERLKKEYADVWYKDTEQIYVVRNEHFEYGALDQYGDVVVPLKYNMDTRFYRRGGNYVSVSTTERTYKEGTTDFTTVEYEGLYCMDGREIIPPTRYQFVNVLEKFGMPPYISFYSGDKRKMFDDDGWGICDINGVELIGPFYDSGMYYDKQRGFCKKDSPFNIFLNPDGTLDTNRTKELALTKPASKSAKFWATTLNILTILGNVAAVYGDVYAQTAATQNGITQEQLTTSKNQALVARSSAPRQRTQKVRTGKVWDHNATTLSKVYMDYTSQLIKMNTFYERDYDDKYRISIQSSMREIRNKLNQKYTDNYRKSEWEDWDGRKKK